MAVLFTDRQTVPHIPWPGRLRLGRSAHATMLSRHAIINIDPMFVLLQALVHPACGASLAITLHSFPASPALPSPFSLLPFSISRLSHLPPSASPFIPALSQAFNFRVSRVKTSLRIRRVLRVPVVLRLTLLLLLFLFLFLFLLRCRLTGR